MQHSDLSSQPAYGFNTLMTSCGHALLNLCYFIKNNTIGDLYEILMFGPQFINGELYQRSLETGLGIAHIGPAWQNVLPKLVVVSGKESNFRKVLSYGETDPDNLDRAARQPIHDQIHRLFGDRTFITKQGEEARKERTHFNNFITSKRAIDEVVKICDDVFEDCINTWDSTALYQDNIIYFVANIIGKQLAGIDHIPKEYIPLLRRFDKVLNSGKGGAELHEAIDKVLAMNAELMTPDKVKTQGTHVTPYLPTDYDNLSLEEKKAALADTRLGAGIIAQSNLSMLIMGLLAELYENKEMLHKLREELIENDQWQDSSKELQKLPYLHCCYLEALRYFSPGSLLVRKTSRPFDLTVEDQRGLERTYSIPKQSHLFTPLRQNVNDPAVWKNPRTFNPSRFEEAENQKYLSKMVEDYFVPFGSGNRPCPAGAVFVPVVAKLFIAKFVSQYNLQLNEPVVPIPVEKLHVCWDVPYYAEVEKYQKQEKTLGSHRL